MPVKRSDTKPKEAVEPDVDDTAARCLSPVDRKKLVMDAWEPSLLRKLLKAQNRLKLPKRG